MSSIVFLQAINCFNLANRDATKKIKIAAAVWINMELNVEIYYS